MVTIMSSGVSKVLIVEPNPGGHRFYYVAVLIRDVLARGGWPILVTTEEARASAEWSLHLSALPDASFGVMTVQSFETTVLERLSTEVSAVKTVIPDGDHYLRSFLTSRWRGSGNVSILIMRPDGQSGTPIERWLRGILKRAATRAINLKSGMAAHLLVSPMRSRGRSRLFVRDPVQLSASDTGVAAARSRLDAEGIPRWVGVFGTVTTRKNLDVIARAVAMLDGVGLLVAGTVPPESLAAASRDFEALAALGRPVQVWAGGLDDRELDAAILAVDCVVAAHSNEGSSGIVGKAAAASKPIVVAGAQSLRRDARRLGDQAVWTVVDSNEIARGIAKLITGPRREGVTVFASQDDSSLSILLD